MEFCEKCESFLDILEDKKSTNSLKSVICRKCLQTYPIEVGSTLILTSEINVIPSFTLTASMYDPINRKTHEDCIVCNEKTISAWVCHNKTYYKFCTKCENSFIMSKN